MGELHRLYNALAQDLVLGLQVFNLLGQFTLGAAGDQHQQGLEEPSHVSNMPRPALDRES